MGVNNKIYTEEEVKDLLLKILYSETWEIERSYYPDGSIANIDNEEFEQWFEANKKK